MGTTQPNRPTPITVIIILWLILGVWNIWVAVQGIRADLGSWHLLSNPLLPEWFKMAGPVELGINSAVLGAALLQLLAVYGLFAGKRWSYKLALTVPLIIAGLNMTSSVLYASAPPEISQNLVAAIAQGLGSGVLQIALVIVSWKYLNKPEAKTFLDVRSPSCRSLSPGRPPRGRASFPQE